MDTNIVAVQNNQKVVIVTLPAGLSATTTLTTLTVSSAEFLSGTTLFRVTGVTVGSQTTFTISATHNNLPERVYFYKVEITAGGNIYVIDAGGYNIDTVSDYESTITGSESTTNYYNKLEINIYTGTTATLIAGKLGATSCAVDSAKLNNHSVSYFLSTGSTALCASTAGNALALCGCTPASFLGAASCACDSAKLGTKLPAYYLNTGSTALCATNSACLGGVLPAGYLTTNSSISIKTGTTYVVQTTDSGKILEFTNTGSTSIYLPTGLTTGFQATITNVGGGNKTFCQCTNSVIHSLCSHVILANAYNMATIYYRCTNNWVIGGNLC